MSVVIGIAALMLSALAGAQAAGSAATLRASELIGMQVVDTQGEHLGEISELVVNLEEGRVHHAVLDFGGWLGLGEKIFPYPLSALILAGDRLLLRLDRESVERAPGFISARLVGNRRLALATELMDTEVRNRQGAEIGEIEDLLVDIASGRIIHAFIEMEAGPERDEVARVELNLIERGPGADLWLEMDAGELRHHTP